jgi:hypothetical protein
MRETVSLMGLDQKLLKSSVLICMERSVTSNSKLHKKFQGKEMLEAEQNSV